jgi:hypothetical protein
MESTGKAGFIQVGLGLGLHLLFNFDSMLFIKPLVMYQILIKTFL